MLLQIQLARTTSHSPTNLAWPWALWGQHVHGVYDNCVSRWLPIHGGLDSANSPKFSAAICFIVAASQAPRGTLVFFDMMFLLCDRHGQLAHRVGRLSII